MNLQEMLKEAIEESNQELREEKDRQFKAQVKKVIRAISDNNAKIQDLLKDNEELKAELSSLDYKEFEDIKL